MSHSEPKLQEGQEVFYVKNGEKMTIVSWSFDDKPGGPLYQCSDGLHHREWNLMPADQLSTDAENLIKVLTETKKEAEKEAAKKKEEEEHYKTTKTNYLKSIPDNKQHAIEQWSIDANMDLIQKAADFYLTNEAAMDFSVFKPQAEAAAEYLAFQFSQYLAMAIGGELRHTKTSEFQSWVSKPVLEVLQKIGRDRLVHYHITRNQAWYLWAEIYQPKDTKKRAALIRTSRRIFRRGRWNHMFGGNNWSAIARTLYGYLNGEITPTLFVDTVFGLYHNSNLVLDKVWDVKLLKHTLDENFKHNMDSLYNKCSEDVKGVVSLYRRFKNYGEA